MPPKAAELPEVGYRFPETKLVFIEAVKLPMTYGREKGKLRTFWQCQCDCGKITAIRPSELKYFRAKSCGCKLQEVRRNYSVKHPVRKSSNRT